MKELSIFIDESGDLGEYDYHAPFYIISMVLHNQDIDITNNLKALENELKNIGWPDHCVHAGPVIRSEEEYRGYELKDRQKILMKMMTFIRHLDIQFKSIYIEKKHIEDSVEATGKLSKQLADLICTLRLTELKLDNHLLSKSETSFFGDERTLKKNYLKPLAKKRL